MKHTIVGWLLAFVLFPSIALAAGSATLDFDNASIKTQQGESFDIVLIANPNGEALDTVRAVITFDPTIVRAQSATLVGEFNRSAPGNYIDNQTGKVSWGAFTIDGPVTSVTEFATLTFTALQEGSANIAISSDSKMIADGQEKIASKKTDQARVAVSPAQDVDSATPLIVVESSSHPNTANWYNRSDVLLSWSVLEAEKSVTAYYYTFDQKASTDPTQYLSASENSMNIDGVQDGLRYFHIKGALQGGGFTPTVHRRVQIDTTAPNDFEVSAQDTRVLEKESVWLTFATTDETSGVSQYQMAINTSAFQVQESPLEIADLSAGTYFFRVAAFDRAGNVKYSGLSVRVYPEGTDLSRVDDYEQSLETEQIIDAMKNQSDDSQEKNQTRDLLITLVLVGLLSFGIIYWKKIKK